MYPVLCRCWLGGRKGIRAVKNLSGGVIGLERDADLHTAQLMPLPLTVSCFSKIQVGFAFLVLAHPGSLGKRAVKRVRVCVCVCERERASCIEIPMPILSSRSVETGTQKPLFLHPGYRQPTRMGFPYRWVGVCWVIKKAAKMQDLKMRIGMRRAFVESVWLNVQLLF